MTHGEIALAALCAIVIIGLLALEGIALYLIHTRSEELLGYFRNSPALFAKGALVNGGAYGKLLLFGDIARTIAFPKSRLKSRKLSAEDLRNIPPTLKFTLTAIYWSFITLMFGGLIAVVIIQTLLL